MRPFFAFTSAALCAFSSACTDAPEVNPSACESHVDCESHEVCETEHALLGGTSGDLECRPFSAFDWKLTYEYTISPTCEEEPEELEDTSEWPPCQGGPEVHVRESSTAPWALFDGMEYPTESWLLRFLCWDYDLHSDVDFCGDVYISAMDLFSAWKMSPSGEIEILDAEGNTLLIELRPRVGG